MIDFHELVEAIKATRVYDVAKKTALDLMPQMSERLDNEVYLKREDQQDVFSFKIRGAYNKISSLSQVPSSPNSARAMRPVRAFWL